MKISKLIEELLSTQRVHGDIEVAALDGDGHLVTNIYTTSEPYYYDGGCLYWDEENKNWLRSKKHPELGSGYCYIFGLGPNMGLDYDEYIEGVLIPHMGDGWSEEKFAENKALFKKVYSGEK